MSLQSLQPSRRMRRISNFVALAGRLNNAPGGMPVRTSVKAGLKITFTDVVVSSSQTSGSSGN